MKIESSYNFAPEVDVGGTELSGLTNVPGIEDATKIFLSENGNFAFVGDKDGDIAVFKVTDGKLLICRLLSILLLTGLTK